MPARSSQSPERQFALNLLLSTTQHPVQEGIFSHILWDLREHPASSAQYVLHLGTTLTQATLSEPATYPPKEFLLITCELPHPWNLVVTSSASPPGGSPLTLQSHSPTSTTSSASSSSPYVTVYDVLKSIYNDLLTRVPLEELEALHERQRNKVMDAFERRWKTSINPSPEEVCRAGVRKVDMLMQHTLFGGLSVDPDQESTCILSLRRPS